MVSVFEWANPAARDPLAFWAQHPSVSGSGHPNTETIRYLFVYGISIT